MAKRMVSKHFVKDLLLVFLNTADKCSKGVTQIHLNVSIKGHFKLNLDWTTWTAKGFGLENNILFSASPTQKKLESTLLAKYICDWLLARFFENLIFSSSF